MTRLIRDPSELREYVEMAERNRFSLGFVPTMGALHAGHASLMKRCWAENDRTVVSVYVNPLQFGPHEDFERYPRQVEKDLALCEAERADVVFAPSVADLAPPGRTTVVRVEGVTSRFEGALRPGHFDGVATIVATLFHMVRPTRAYFGQKDYQQTVVIRRMVRDLRMAVDVVVCPTLCDPDGLAMSSRNVYLSADDRAEGLRLPGAIRAVEGRIAEGETDCESLRALLRERMTSPRADVVVDYADVADADTLEPLARIESRAVILAVLRVGKVRLLDNAVVAVPGGGPSR